MTTLAEQKNEWWTVRGFEAGFIAAELYFRSSNKVQAKVEKAIDKAIAVECLGRGAKNRNELVSEALKTYRDRAVESSLLSRAKKADFRLRDLSILAGVGIWFWQNPHDFFGQEGVEGLAFFLKFAFDRKIRPYDSPGVLWRSGSFNEAVNDTLQRGIRLQTVKGPNGQEIPNEEGKPQLLTQRRTFIARTADLGEPAPGEKRRRLPGGRTLVTKEATAPEVGNRKNAYGAVQCLDDKDPSPPSGGSSVEEAQTAPVLASETETEAVPAFTPAAEPISIPGESQPDRSKVVLYGPDGKTPLVFDRKLETEPIFAISMAKAHEKPWHATIGDVVSQKINSLLQFVGGTAVFMPASGSVVSAPVVSVPVPARAPVLLRPVVVVP